MKILKARTIADVIRLYRFKTYAYGGNSGKDGSKLPLDYGITKSIQESAQYFVKKHIGLFCYITKLSYFASLHLENQVGLQVKEKIKHLIAEHLIRKAQLKTTLRNMNAIGIIDDHLQNNILDEIKETEHSIQKLTSILNHL